MLELITGVPGSGKTYKAVNTLYDTFLNDKSKLYKANSHFFTNINEFRFDIFPDGVAYKLNFDDFYSKLNTLHDSAITHGKNDTQLKDQAKELNLLNALIIIDEAHNYFDKDDNVLIWWTSYQRHLGQNIILLTQSLDLLNRKYKKFAESFLRAVPSSLRLFGSVFRYKRYIDYKMYEKQLIGTEKLKFNQDVYNLYQSGSNQQSQKVIWKFFAIAGFAFFVLLLVFYLIYKKWSPSVSEKNTTVSASSAAAGSVSSQVPALSPKTYEYIRLLCSDSSCVYQGVTLTNADVDNLKRKYQLQLLSVTPFSPDFQIYVYRSSKIGVSNEILAGTN